jgi:hypothetical protein
MPLPKIYGWSVTENRTPRRFEGAEPRWLLLSFDYSNGFNNKPCVPVSAVAEKAVATWSMTPDVGQGYIDVSANSQHRVASFPRAGRLHKNCISSSSIS